MLETTCPCLSPSCNAIVGLPFTGGSLVAALTCPPGQAVTASAVPAHCWLVLL